MSKNILEYLYSRIIVATVCDKIIRLFAHKDKINVDAALVSLLHVKQSNITTQVNICYLKRFCVCICLRSSVTDHAMESLDGHTFVFDFHIVKQKCIEYILSYHLVFCNQFLLPDNWPCPCEQHFCGRKHGI